MLSFLVWKLSYFVLKLYVLVQLTKVHEELRASNLLLADMGQMNSTLQLQLLSLEVLLHGIASKRGVLQSVRFRTVHHFTTFHAIYTYVTN